MIGASLVKRKCPSCGEKFRPKRRDAEFCSSLCRQAAYRIRRQNESEEEAKFRARGAERIIYELECYRSIAAVLHVEAEALNLETGFLGTQYGILIAERAPGAIERARPLWKERHCTWLREIDGLTTESPDVRAAIAMTEENLGGSFIQREAEAKFRKLVGASHGVSLLIEDWDYHTERTGGIMRLPDVSWLYDYEHDEPPGDDSVYIDAAELIAGGGYEIK